MQDLDTGVLDRARTFIAEVPWMYGKTMLGLPHEYVTRWTTRRLGFEGEFEWLVQAIMQHGERRPQGPYRAAEGPWQMHIYLDIDDWTYWATRPDQATARTTLINRERLADGHAASSLHDPSDT